MSPRNGVMTGRLHKSSLCGAIRGFMGKTGWEGIFFGSWDDELKVSNLLFFLL